MIVFLDEDCRDNPEEQEKQVAEFLEKYNKAVNDKNMELICELKEYLIMHREKMKAEGLDFDSDEAFHAANAHFLLRGMANLTLQIHHHEVIISSLLSKVDGGSFVSSAGKEKMN